MTSDNPTIEQPSELSPELRQAIAQAVGGDPAAVMVGLVGGRRVALAVDAKDYRYDDKIRAYAGPCHRCGPNQRYYWDGQEFGCEAC